MSKSKPRDLDRHLRALVQRELERIAADPGEHPSTVEKALERLAMPQARVSADQVESLPVDMLRFLRDLLEGKVTYPDPHALPKPCTCQRAGVPQESADEDPLPAPEQVPEMAQTGTRAPQTGQNPNPVNKASQEYQTVASRLPDLERGWDVDLLRNHPGRRR